MSVLTPGRNIVLIGMMGAGKSTVGRMVAERLGRPFVDTDELVEWELEQPVAHIFAHLGERAFRNEESRAVRAVTALRGQVVAVGGGALQRTANVTHLRGTGDLVLLDAGPAELAERVGADAGATRPLLDGATSAEERLAQLRAERHATYRLAADHVEDTTGRTPEEVADAIVAWAATRPGLLAADEVVPR